MLTENQFNQFVALFSIWEKLSAAQKKSLRGAVSFRSYHKDQLVHNGVTDCSGLFLVKSGVLRVFFTSESGKEITLCRLLSRDFCQFSASCLMKNITFPVTITAEKETELYLIPTALYRQLTEESLAVSNLANQILASHFSDVMWVMEQVLFTSFDRRLASFLLEQRAIDGSNVLHITQEEIAHHLGSAREVVTRMLKYFQSEGMVSLFRGGIELQDTQKLEQQTH